MVRALFLFPDHDIAHYDFVTVASIHEHFHPQEEVFKVTEGGLELAIERAVQKIAAGAAAIVPPRNRDACRAVRRMPPFAMARRVDRECPAACLNSELADAPGLLRPATKMAAGLLLPVQLHRPAL